jgi:hypothetical protein
MRGIHRIYLLLNLLKFDIAIEIVIFLPQIARIGTDALRLTQIRTDFIGLCFCD